MTPLSPSWSPPDFDAAAHELLIALPSTACWRQVLDEDEWEAWWLAAPVPAPRAAGPNQSYGLIGPRICPGYRASLHEAGIVPGEGDPSGGRAPGGGCRSACPRFGPRLDQAAKAGGP